MKNDEKWNSEREAGVSVLFSVAVGVSCLTSALMVASLFLKGNTYSWLCAGMIFALLLTVEGYLMRRCRREGTARVCAFRWKAAGDWLRGGLALLLAYGLTARFYSKYAAAQLGGGQRQGRLAALFESVALPEWIKDVLLVCLVALLAGLCLLNAYALLSAMFRSEADGVAADAERRHGFCMRRFLCMLAPLFALSFTVVFFGPTDLVLENGAYLYVQSGDFWPALLGIALCAALLPAVLTGFMNKGASRLLLCVAFGLALAAYLQGTFATRHLGTLDGTAVDWAADRTAAIVGAALWLLAVAVQIIANRIFCAHYVKAAVFLSCAIVAMQLTALVSVAMTEGGEGSRYVLDGESAFTVSSKENVVVFTLDRLSNTTMERAMEQYPQIKTELKDFVYFDNTSQRYRMTFPSLAAMLTGQEYDPRIPARLYTQRAWKGKNADAFYGALKARNYECNLYVDDNYAAIDAENMLGKVDNVTIAPVKLTGALLSELVKVSAYRYAPLCAKELFWTTTEYINALTQLARDGVTPLATDERFYRGLLDRGLTVAQDKNYFSWHHLQGAHDPHVLNADGFLADHPTDAVTQTRGYLVAIDTYLRQMRELGVYDDATIILSADHGKNPDEPQIILLIKRPHQTHAQLEVRHAPAAQMDVLPTILDCLGEPYAALGTSVFDLSEEQERERVTSYFEVRKEYPPAKWIGEHGLGNEKVSTRFNVLTEYRYIGDREAIRKKIESGVADAMIPLYETYY